VFTTSDLVPNLPVSIAGRLGTKSLVEEKQWSVIQRTSKHVTVTLDTDEERINLLYIQTYSWKEKLAVLMLPRSQGSLQRTKTLILKPGKRFSGIFRSTLRRRVC